MNNNKATSGTIEDAFPLSMLQQGMLFHSSLDEHLGVYHDVFSYEIETRWDEAKFSEMLDFIIARHSVLRTIYRMDGARPLQVVMKHKAPFLEIADLRNRDESERKEALTEWLAAEKRVAIDPAKNVWKAFVHVLSNTQIQFGLSFHHALWDGWSVANFVSELFAGYAALLDGKTTSSFNAEKPPSYRSFVALEQQALNSAENKAYWADKLLDAKTPWWTGEKSGQSQFFLCEVSKEQSEQVIATANELDVAEKSIWCAIYLSLVAVLNGSLDAIGSIATHGRPEIANSDKMLGLFLNTLPLRVNLKNMKWRELVKAVDAELLEQYAYRHHPLVDIQNQTGLDFSASMFGYLNFRVYGDSGVKSQILGGQGFEETNYRMVVSVEKLEASRRHVLRINADTSLFNERYQTHIRAYVNNIIDSVTTRKDQFINTGKLIGADERALQLAQFTQSKGVETGEQTLLTAFEQVRQQHPDAMAFISESAGLSYQQLDLQSNQLANYLRAEGVRQSSVLAIVLSPSAELLVSVLAALKLACSYVLIDARKSTQSVSWIARKTGANLIIRHSAASRALPSLSEEVRQIFIDQCAYLDASAAAPDTRVDPNTIAAITYTQAQEKQGLTPGFSHASLLRFAQARAGKASFQEQVKGLGDLSVQLWTHLLAGEALDFASMISDAGNVSLSSTSLARSAVGEFYVLRQLDLVPIGSSGELFLGGDTVADVIAASPRLSASKLIPHPFSEQAGKRLFATGLTAKLDVDGNLEILSQDPVQAETIRLAGLKKSEQVLRLHSGIRDVAMERDSRFGGPGKLVAYCVMDDNSKEMTADLLTLLRNQAQPCVLPSVLTQVSSVTRYPNGKVDFSQLPSPFAQSREDNFEVPVGACEELLANIWIDLLKCGRVGRNANFFELGGYSLIGMQLVARIRNVFGVELPLRDVFERKDLKSQALLIEQAQLQGSALPALEVVDRSQPLPLSFSQQRLWFLSRMMPPNAVYNIPFALRLRGKVDESALVHSLNAIISRHEALRTRFADVDGQAVQLIDPPGRPCVVVEDIDSEAVLHSRILAERHYCFDLSNEPLVRLRVLNTRFDGHHVLLATFHHIVADGWSMGVFFKELVELYRTTVAAPGAQITPLAPLRLQFADYAHWQRQQLTGNVIAAQLSYWEHQLAGLPPLLDLPTDLPRPAEQRYRGATAMLKLPASLTGELQALNRRSGSTLFMSLIAAFAVLLGRYARQHDIAIGTPVANRRHSETEDLIGFFLNSLVMRFDLQHNPSFTDLLSATRDMALEAYAHQDIPFEHLVERLNPVRSLSHAPLFQVSCSLVNTPVGGQAFPGIDVDPLQISEEQGVARYDLTFNFSVQADGSLLGSMEYNTDLFKAETIERLLGHYERLLEAVVAAPQEAIGELDFLSDAERQQQLQDWNPAARTDSPQRPTSPDSVHALFARQALHQPDAIAVVDGAHQISYRELDRRANRLAHYLIAQGVVADNCVGLCVERSADMIVGLLGILKAGAAYVPLDPAYPASRLQHMIATSACKLILSEQHLLEELSFLSDYQTLPLDGHWHHALLGRYSDSAPAVTVVPDQLAYIIFTSGSTGVPKGIAINHKSIVRLVLNGFVPFPDLQAYLCAASLSFDAFTFELWGALLHGKKSVLFEFKSNSLEALGETIRNHRVECAWLTAALFNQVIVNAGQSLRDLKYLLVGGEALSKEHIQRALDEIPEVTLVNGYGPTENTTFSCTYTIRERDTSGLTSIPIGVPIDHSLAYVLNEQAGLLPTGCVGELFVGGEGLARAYINQPALTAEKFIPHPYSKVPGARLYRTGDLVRQRQDGNIEYIGRADDQVKVRGFRIELGEIESVIAQHAAVSDVAVIVQIEQANQGQLVAYIVTDKTQLDEDVDIKAALLSHLQGRIPDYAIPGAFVLMDVFPLTRNGKLDRARLPKPDESAYARKQYVAPKTALEEKLVALWKKNLAVDQLGTEDNYFAIGGDSIRSISLVAEAKKTGLFFAIRDLFANPTIASLAGVVKEGEADAGKRVEVAAFALLTDNERSQLPQTVDGHAVEDAYPLSLLQQGMLFHSLRDPELNIYQNVLSFLLELEWNESRFRLALESLITIHPILRTVFHLDADRPLQLVIENPDIGIKVFDLTDKKAEDLQTLVLELQDRELENGIALTAPWRVFVCLLPKGRILLNFVIHHALMDGWSDASFIKQALEVYALLMKGEAAPQLLQPPRFSNFIALEQEALASAQYRQYWKAELEGIRVPWWSASQKTASVRFECPVSADTSKRISVLADALKVQEKSIWCAVYLSLISLLDGSQKAVGSVVTHGRPEIANGEHMLGLFLNALPLPFDLQGMKWNALIKYTDTRLGDYYNIRHYPLAAIQSDTGLDFAASAFNYTNFHLYKNANVGTELDVGGGFDETNYRLLVNVRKNEADATHFFLINAEPTVFDQAMRARIVGYVASIIDELTNNTDAAIDKAVLLKTEIASLQQDAKVEKFPDICVHESIELHAKTQPDATALVFNGNSLTYQELNQRANRLAHCLRERGVALETPVGVCLPPSFDLVISILAVLKAGGCYVPIDPNYPASRRDYVIDNSAVNVILTHQQYIVSKLAHITDVALIAVDEVAAEEGAFVHYPASDLDTRHLGLTPANAVYVIYTSGSTGKPKGVLATHQALINRLYWAQQTFGVEADDIFCQKTRIGFVDHAAEIFQALVAARPLLIVPEEQAGSPLHLLESLAHHDITRITLVPSLLKAMLAIGQPLPQLRHIFCSGEALVLGDEFAALSHCFPNASLHNVYGSTEVGADVTCHHVEQIRALKPGAVPIGHAISNTSAFVLDEQFNRVPIDVVGQLYIGGAGLARGYLHNAAETAKSFIPNPFTQSGSAGERLYKMGDMVRMSADGCLEYVGRRDHQVKIRGFRIELAEIEQAASRLPQVQQAVTKVWEGQGSADKKIVLYLTTTAKALEHGELKRNLRKQLQQTLPDYMWPASISLLESMPLTPSGKLDRHALPLPVEETGDSDFIAPAGTTEEILASLWTELLRRSRVGRQDNFFELGGHSLIATQLLSRIREVFSCTLPMRQLFEHQTLEEQARAIDAFKYATQKEDVRTIEPVPRTEHLALSYAQQRLWFLDQLMGPGPTYNIPLALRLSGNLQVDYLVSSLNEILKRHEVLRTQFSKYKGEAVQAIRPFQYMDIAVEEVSSHNELESIWIGEKNYCFNLTADLLVRFRIVKDLSDITPSYVLCVVFHHIVSDGWSLGIFFRELIENYQALESAKPLNRTSLRIQYPDFAHWQRDWLNGSMRDTQLAYWRDRLAGLPTSLDLPFDRARPPEQTFNGESISISLPKDLSDQLQQLSRKQGATLFMTLISAYAILLGRYARQDDVVIGTPVANRSIREAEELIGFFVNTVAIRNRIPGDLRFADFLKSTRENCLDAYAHQDIPFEFLVESLNPQRSLSHSPIFQVMFILQNTPVEAASFNEVDILPVEFHTRQSNARFDLTLGLKETADGIIGSLEFNTDLFNRSTMLRFAACYEYLLEQIVSHPQLIIDDLKMIREPEMQQQLTTWNATAMAYPESQTLHGLFEAQVASAPGKTALIANGTSLSYQQLNDRANQRAAVLLSLGVAPEHCVGICLNRTAESLISILAVLKAGACYVPIDPAYPASRVQYLLNDADMHIVITTTELRERLGIDPDKCLCTDQDADVDKHTNQVLSTNLPPVNPGQLAYIIYTSGSTGRPKGVAINHQSGVSLLHWAAALLPESDRTGVLATTSFCFDLSIYEIFLPLTTGQTCILIDNILALEKLDEHSKQQITLINTVPSAAKVLLDRKAFPAGVKVLNLAGEPLKAALVDRLYTETPIAQVYDLYGPSEGTTYSSYVKRQAQGIETIGWPVANTQFYVLSPTGQLLPQGVTGELYIGGIGVARGYLQRPGLTAEKFLPDRFSPQPGSRLYRTGDLVRYLPDGKLAYLGRADHQVKVRGFRIELGEIESTCLQQPGIKDAVVIVREDQPEYRQIVAYLVPHQQTDSNSSNSSNSTSINSYTNTNTSNAALTDSLKASLQKQLPAYMMPSAFVVLSALPLTPNGKLDRAALPVPDGAEQRVGYVAPQGEVEQRVAALWEGLLRRQQVGRFDNFFELGGHSLLVTQLASRIEEAFSIAVNIKIFYKYSTLKDIAARVEKMVALETLADDAIEQMSEEEVAELLSDFEALENN